jgi:MraZ protein
MTFFTSEYECKLDAKGRLVLPSRIKSQLPDDSRELVIRRGLSNASSFTPWWSSKKSSRKFQG